MSKFFAIFRLEDVNKQPIFIENCFINFELVFSSLALIFQQNSISLYYPKKFCLFLCSCQYFLHSLSCHHSAQ